MFLSSIVFFENRSYHCRSVFVYGRHSNSLLRITTFNSADHKFRLYYEILIVVNTNLDAGWLHCTHCALRFYDTGNRSNLLLWLRNKLLLWLRQKLLLLLQHKLLLWLMNKLLLLLRHNLMLWLRNKLLLWLRNKLLLLLLVKLTSRTVYFDVGVSVQGIRLNLVLLNQI